MSCNFSLKKYRSSPPTQKNPKILANKNCGKTYMKGTTAELYSNLTTSQFRYTSKCSRHFFCEVTRMVFSWNRGDVKSPHGGGSCPWMIWKWFANVLWTSPMHSWNTFLEHSKFSKKLLFSALFSRQISELLHKFVFHDIGIRQMLF